MKKEIKEINVTIGANIKRERERAGLTQERLSEFIGINPTSLSAIERGTVGISLTSLQKVCETLSVSSDALIFGDEAKSDGQYLVERLERLSPKQYDIVNTVVTKLLEAFALNPEEN